MKKALITGITGQDGSYLAELLLEKGYQVHGVVRRVALEDPERRLGRIRHLLDRVKLHCGSLDNYASLFQIVQRVKPRECYHLDAQSYVSYSFEDEFSTMTTNVNGTLFMLSALKENAPRCRFYFAGSSEMFGLVHESPQSELTRFHPRSPYGVSKVTGFYLTQNYRESYRLFACSGILFNHESPRRGHEFVTRKISRGAAAIKLGLAKKITLGNLKAERDWGYAPEYVQAMWLMLQQKNPEDFVIATEETHTVQEFAAAAFKCVGLDWRKHVAVDPALLRPSEVHELRGNIARARKKLGWQPKVKFEKLVRIMVESDLKELRKEHNL